MTLILYFWLFDLWKPTVYVRNQFTESSCSFILVSLYCQPVEENNPIISYHIFIQYALTYRGTLTHILKIFKFVKDLIIFLVKMHWICITPDYPSYVEILWVLNNIKEAGLRYFPLKPPTSLYMIPCLYSPTGQYAKNTSPWVHGAISR